MVGDVVLSVEEMLARASAAVKSGKTTANMSEVEKLLAQRENPLPEDIVELSPVQKILAARQEREAAESESYFESDDYLQLKANQLRAQLAIYSNLPGLDPTGAVLNGIEAEIRSILETQQAKLQETLRKGDEARAALEEQERLAALEPPSAEDMLAKVQGTIEPEPISPAAQKLLDNLDIEV